MKQWLKQLNVLNRKRPALPEGEDKAEGRERSPKASHGQPNTLVQADGGTSVDTRRAHAASAVGSGAMAGATPPTGDAAPGDSAEADADQEVKRLRMAGAI
jgi:hypothetical protein